MNSISPNSSPPDNAEKFKRYRPFIIVGVFSLLLAVALWKCDFSSGGAGTGGSGQGGSGGGTGTGSGNGGSGTGSGQAGSGRTDKGKGKGLAQGKIPKGGEGGKSSAEQKKINSSQPGTSAPSGQSTAPAKKNTTSSKPKTMEQKFWRPDTTEKKIWFLTKAYIGRFSKKNAADFRFPEPGIKGTAINKQNDGSFFVRGFFQARDNAGKWIEYDFSLIVYPANLKFKNLQINRK